MKEKLLLVGAGGLGRVVSEHARNIYDCSWMMVNPADWMSVGFLLLELSTHWENCIRNTINSS